MIYQFICKGRCNTYNNIKQMYYCISDFQPRLIRELCSRFLLIKRSKHIIITRSKSGKRGIKEQTPCLLLGPQTFCHRGQKCYQFTKRFLRLLCTFKLLKDKNVKMFYPSIQLRKRHDFPVFSTSDLSSCTFCLCGFHPEAHSSPLPRNDVPRTEAT